ncbi:hypothetical protein HA402_001613, partial [Bradysia odoriphaga]
LRDEIVLLYENNSTLPEKGRLCEADFNLIKNWKWDANLTAQYDGTLTVSGWNELKDLGKDYRNTFPDLFGNAYSSERLRFDHTTHYSNRTEATFKAFVEGLFGDGSYNGIVLDRYPQPNKIQNPMSFCPAYDENVNDQNGPNSETSKFRNSDIFLKLRNDVSMKLGYHEPLSGQIIVNIYDMCRFEMSWNVEKSSPWCSVLTPSQFEILEYLDDLQYYMKRSYGSAINSKLFCFGMDEMLGHISTNGSQKVVAYFGHTYLYHLYLTALGAFKDTIALRSDNFDAMANRKWRNSEINPVASNIATVRYSCPNDVEETVKVKFFVNQKTLNFDWCDNSGLCNLSDVLEQYSLFRDGDCEEIFCSTGDDSSGHKFSSKLVSILFFSLALVAII